MNVKARYLATIALPLCLLSSGTSAQDYAPGGLINGRILVSVDIDYSSPRMAGLRHYYDEFFGSSLDNKPGAGIDILYALSQRMMAGVGISYLRVGTDGKITTEYRDPNGNIVVEETGEYAFDASLICPSLLISYLFSVKGLDSHVTVGQGLCFGSARRYWALRSPSLVYERDRRYKSLGPGFSIAGGASYRLVKGLSAKIDVGYRYLTTGDLRTGGGDALIVDSHGQAAILDFSAFYISAGLSFRL